jgi:membrane protein YqaA with SNARE-associated domain
VRAFASLLVASGWTGSLSFFLQLGIFGPFVVETLDSSFFYMPLANELLFIALITQDGPQEGNVGMCIVYASMAALGSVAGVLLADSIMRKAGEKALKKFVKPKRLEALRVKLLRNAGRVVFIASALPPPVPFRAVVLTASAFQCPRRNMLWAVFTGRLIRFIIEALLVLYFGSTLLTYLSSKTLEYTVYALLCVAIVGSALTIYKWFGSARETQAS